MRASSRDTDRHNACRKQEANRDSAPCEAKPYTTMECGTGFRAGELLPAEANYFQQKEVKKYAPAQYFANC